MRELSVRGLSADAQAIVVFDPATDTLLRVPISGDLVDLIAQHRTASVTPHPPTGSERTMDAILTPREIQSRIRRGQSPAELAEESSMSLSQIEAFAGPVLAEREYMVGQARRSPVRRKHLSSSPEPLHELVEAGLRDHSVDPELAEWDAARQSDGLWAVTVSVGGHGTFRFVFDAASRFVRPSDHAAHELIGDVALPASEDMALAEVVSAAGETEVAGGSPSPEVQAAPNERDSARGESITDTESHTSVEHAADIDRALRGELELDLGLAEGTAGRQLDLPAVSSLKDARERRAQAALAQHDARPPHDHDTEQLGHPALNSDSAETSDDDTTAASDSQPAKKRHERRRVPSWDEIMFGGKES